MSASVHPTTGTQPPLVGPGAPSGTGNSPPLPATGGAKIQSNTAVSPVKTAMPGSPTNNHNLSPPIPVGFVQEHKAGGNGLTQPQVPLQRTPEKNKDLMLGSPVTVKPTSNGVEGNEDPLPAPVTNTPLEMINTDMGDMLASIQNHANETLPVTEMPVQQLGIVSTTDVEEPLPLADVSQMSPAKVEDPSPPDLPENNPFENLNSVEDSVIENSTEPSPDLAAPDPISVASPVTTPQLPTSTTDAPPSPPVVSQLPVQESPPKVSPPPVEVAKPVPEMPKSELKVASPPRNKRKKETKLEAEMKELSLEDNIDRKSKRQRTRTQPYQCPLPEQAYMPKFKSNTKHDTQDKLIVFYKNEFLAVRNAEGGFYICQATQNIYKSSARIRIRWLSQDQEEGPMSEKYIPDFYDHTDFDCILTNLDLKKLDKNKYQLPPEEKDRTLSILNRALDVEKGVAESVPVTEEHPDGLDLSLYRDEAQLKKKSLPKKAVKKDAQASTDSGDESADSEEEPTDGEDAANKTKPKPKVDKKTEKTKSPAKDKSKAKEKDSVKSEPEREKGRERGSTTKRGSESLRSATAKPPTEKKAKLSVSEKKTKATPPKQTRKAPVVATTPESPTSTRSTKSRSGSKDTPKSSSLTRTKERERRSAAIKSKEPKQGKRVKSESD